MDNSIKTLILVVVIGAVIGLGFYVKSQIDKAYELGFDTGRAEYQKEVNDFIVNSLNNEGQVKIRYQGPDGTQDLILIPKR